MEYGGASVEGSGSGNGVVLRSRDANQIDDGEWEPDFSLS